MNDTNVTHLEPALIGTASLTFSTSVCPLGAGASFLPPDAANAMAAVLNIVPRARCSFLMARPKITLENNATVSENDKDPL